MFSRDVTAALLVSLNKGTAAMLMSPSNLVEIELSYANFFFVLVLIDHVSENTLWGPVILCKSKGRGGGENGDPQFFFQLNMGALKGQNEGWGRGVFFNKSKKLSFAMFW